MARPKSGTEAGRIATEKWRKTMLAKYGNKEAMSKEFQRIGSIGGQNGHTGGFYANPERARLAGSKGGRISKRGAGSITKTKIEPNVDKIEKLYYNGKSIPQISKELGIPYSSLLKWAKMELVGYGAKDDIERYEMILEYERGRNK